MKTNLLNSFGHSLRTALVCCSVMFFAASCSESEEGNEHLLSLPVSELALNAYNADERISVYATDSWTATSDVDWLTITPESGESSDFGITISADENESTTPRSASVVVAMAGGKTATIKVTQAAGEAADNGTADNVYLVMRDEKFIAYCKGKLFDRGDGILTPEEAAMVTEIDVNGMNITSLRGIQYFTELESLDCSKNKLKTLDVSKNTKLEFLECYDNQLKNPNVNNSALRFLYCHNNRIETLDVSKNMGLFLLECYNNKLQSLDLSKNTGLVRLDCKDNQLKTLDISNNTSLNRLSVTNNSLTQVLVWKDFSSTALGTLEVDPGVTFKEK